MFCRVTSSNFFAPSGVKVRETWGRPNWSKTARASARSAPVRRGGPRSSGLIRSFSSSSRLSLGFSRRAWLIWATVVPVAPSLTMRNSRTALCPMSLRARSWSAWERPGSSTTIRFCPWIWMRGSATPRALIRFSRTVLAFSRSSRVGFSTSASRTILRPPFRSRPRRTLGSSGAQGFHTKRRARRNTPSRNRLVRFFRFMRFPLGARHAPWSLMPFAAFAARRSAGRGA